MLISEKRFDRRRAGCLAAWPIRSIRHCRRGAQRASRSVTGRNVARTPVTSRGRCGYRLGRALAPGDKTKEGSLRCPLVLVPEHLSGLQPATRRVLLGCLAGSARAELLVELLDAACRVHDLLLTGVERMRFRRHFDLGERVGLAFELARFAGLDGRTGHELEVDRHIDEQNFAVIGVNAFFHGLSYSLAVATPRATAGAEAFRREPLA